MAVGFREAMASIFQWLKNSSVLIALVIKVHIRNCIDLGPPPARFYSCHPRKIGTLKKKSFQLVGPGLLWYLYLMLPVSHNSKASTIFWGGFQVFGAELAINYQVFCFLQMFDQNTYQQKHLRRQVLPEKIQ